VGEGEHTTIGYTTASSQLYVDRTQSGEVAFHPRFPHINSAHLEPICGVVSLNLFVDRTSVEVFANGGELYFSELIFPNSESRGLKLYAIGGTVHVKSLLVYPLHFGKGIID